MTSMLQLALSLAAGGIPVFPCRPDDETSDLKAKSPYIPNGFRGATTSRRIIERWWQDRPNAIVGIPTGSRSGILCIDVDRKNGVDGGEALARLVREHGELPATRKVVTPSGGEHYLFRYVEGTGNRGGFEPGIDVRSEGGFIIAAGSVMADGTFYELVNDAEIAEAPAWLIDLVTRRHEPAAPAELGGGRPASGYVEAAVTAELGDLASTRAGRNNKLNDSSYALGQFVGAGALDRHDAESRLYAAAIANGYVQKDGERAARQTIKSGLDRGALQPRAIPQSTSDDMAAEGARLASRLLAKALAGQTHVAVDDAPGERRDENGTGAPKSEAARADDTIRATPFEWKDPRSLPRRDALYGTHLYRRYLALTVAPGGVGKSSLKIVEALVLATGRALLGTKPPSPLRCWYWNGEDDRDELDRRIMAACLHYNIKPEDIADRLFIDSGRERGIVIAHDEKHGVKIARPVVEQVMQTMIDNKIDVLMIDPFVSSHRVDENDNGAIDMVAKLWSQIAEDTNAAIEVIHHVKKVDGREITVEDGRGASALLAAVRSAHVLNRMSEDQAAKGGVSADDRMVIFNVQNGKANLAPMSASMTWRKMQSVPLGNGSGLTQPQDHVGVVTEWYWPTQEVIAGEFTEEQLQLVRARVGPRECRSSDQSADWVGYAIADALGMKIDVDRKKTPEKVRLARIISAWLASGFLYLDDGEDPKHPLRKVEFVRVAQEQAEE